MKRIIGIILCVCLLATCFSACGEVSQSDATLKIVTTIYPTYDWVKSIVGDSDDYEVTYLTDSGVDLHSYSPSVEDITSIKECDLFIYVGGSSDSWVSYTEEDVVNENQIRLNLNDMLGDDLVAKETKEGMQIVEDECCAEDDYDEHSWLSVKNAITFTEIISETICELDPDNSAMYEENSTAYLQELGDLDDLYTESLAPYENSTLIFGDRFPFIYLFKNYNLEYYAAFSGCTAETEASFETIVFLSGKLDDLDLSYVLNVENCGHQIAETVIQNSTDADQSVLSLSSMENVTTEDVANGTTYISIMQSNLEILVQALEG
ncbi:MAG: metal ABC transporter substrate-binding protein [Clostridia bacterium]